MHAYDNGGNILSKTEYAYTTGTLGAALDTITYGYDITWKDLLTSYDGQTLTSDNIGNLTNDGTWSYMWQHGRQLTQMHRQADYNADIFYEYDANGKRIVKRYEDVIYYENGSGTLSAIRYPVTTYYSYCGDTLSYILIHDDSSRDSGSYRELYFTHDAVGPLSVNYNGAEYFYLKNAQGDVTGIVNAAGTQVVAYTYDAWGKLLSTTGSMAGTLGEYNPLRYRGYVYDTETGLYYLNSRYYNPETGRFINADNVLSGSVTTTSGHNLFSYCDNNPISNADSSGNWPKAIRDIFSAMSTIVKMVVSAVTFKKAPKSTEKSVLPQNGTNSSSFYVERRHDTTQKAMIDMGPVIGKVGYSQTYTEQNKTPSLLYAYTDVGNDETNIGIGVNIAGQFGLDVGASSDGNMYAQAQITKWTHVQVSVGLDGIGLLTATDVDNISNNFEIQAGWGAMLIVIMPELMVAMA